MGWVGGLLACISLPSFGAAVQHFLQERRGKEAHTAAILSLMGEAQERRRRRRGIFPLLLPCARPTDRPTEGGGPAGGRSLVGAAKGGKGGLLLFP